MKDIFAKSLDAIEIASVIDGRGIMDDEWFGNNIKSPFSRIWFIEEGSGYVSFGGKENEINAGNVYLLPAETEFSSRGKKDVTLKQRFFHISVPTLEYFDLFSNFSGIYSLPISEAQAEGVFSLYPEDNYTYLLEVKSIIYKTLVAFMKKYRFEDISICGYSAPVRRAIEYVRRHLSAALTAKEIAEAVFTSESFLRKKFRAEVGISVGGYIDKLLIGKAKHLLVHSSYSIKEISDELGFGDQFYFSRRFKDICGTSPSHYRKENQLFMF